MLIGDKIDIFNDINCEAHNSHAGGRWFESISLHHFLDLKPIGFGSFCFIFRTFVALLFLRLGALYHICTRDGLYAYT